MNPNTKKLTAIAIGTGLLGLCLRLLLYRIGFDEKNILSASHPLHLICMALTLAAAAYLAFSLRASNPIKNFPSSPLKSLGILAAACLTTLHALELSRESGSLMDTARTVLAFCGAAAMVLCVLCGRRSSSLRTAALGIITVFYALDMLCRYRAWSGNPQLPDYCFQIFACLLLSLCSYHQLALATGLGKRRILLFCSLMGLCLCLLCAAGPETGLFYLGGACWAGSCMCAIQPPAEEQEESDVPA